VPGGGAVHSIRSRYGRFASITAGALSTNQDVTRLASSRSCIVARAFILLGALWLTVTSVGSDGTTFHVGFDVVLDQDARKIAGKIIAKRRCTVASVIKRATKLGFELFLTAEHDGKA
jgi:hypothetical protein